MEPGKSEINKENVVDKKGLRANTDLVIDLIATVGFIWLVIGLALLFGLGWMFLIGGIILMAGGIGLAFMRRSE